MPSPWRSACWWRAASYPSRVTTPANPVPPLVFQASGPNPASIQSTVDQYRAALGAVNNGNNPGPLDSGRREINWDGGGSTATSPGPTPFTVFLNTRGANITTPGTGFVQAPLDGLVTTFANPAYATIFQAFSPVRLFSPVGSNVTEVSFSIPGTAGATAATTTGFGVVFSDVDRPDGSGALGRRNADRADPVPGLPGSVVYTSYVPASPGNASLSFFGIVFADARIARVRITAGNACPARTTRAPGRGDDGRLPLRRAPWRPSTEIAPSPREPLAFAPASLPSSPPPRRDEWRHGASSSRRRSWGRQVWVWARPRAVRAASWAPTTAWWWPAIGIRGQGNALKRGFARLKGVEIKTLCDIDANLFASRVNDPSRSQDVPDLQARLRAGPAPRPRRQGRRRHPRGHAEPLARPGHDLGHAGGQTRLRREAGLPHRVGRPQDGRGGAQVQQDRAGGHHEPQPARRAEAIKFLHDGGIGEVYMARGLCYKPRPSIGRYPDGPMQPGEKYRLNVESKEYEPTCDSAYLPRSTTTSGWARPPCAPSTGTASTTTGTGTGTTATATPATRARTSSTSRAGASASASTRSRSRSAGGLFGTRESSQETPNVHTTLFDLRGRQGPRVRDARHDDERRGHAEDRQPLLRHQGLALDRRRRPRLAGLPRPQGREGPGLRRGGRRTGSDPNVLTSIEYPHYQNFIDAIRAGDRKKLTCEIEEGHLSRRCPTSPTSPTA